MMKYYSYLVVRYDFVLEYTCNNEAHRQEGNKKVRFMSD